MGEDNSQNPKNSKKKLFSGLFKEPAPPAPSGPSQKRSLMGRMRSTFSKSPPSLTQTEASAKNPGSGTPSDNALSNPSFSGVNPLGHPAYSMTPISSETKSWAVASAVEDPPNLSPLQGPTQPTALPSQAPEHVNDSGGIQDDAQLGNKDPESPLKKNLKLTGRALQMLLPKAANIVDTNPAKIALGLVKTIIEIKNAVKDNKDAVARQIVSTGSQLEEVANTLDDWKPANQSATAWMNHFKSTLDGELQKLNELSDESNLRKFLDHEDEQGRIQGIFMRINEARVQFELGLGIRIFKAVYEVEQVVKDLLLDRLEPSHIAHHDYILEGDEGRLLRRQVCTPGTRVRILSDIIFWAKNSLLDSPNVYWLFGHAGSGKSTIAYTIARRFEFAGDLADTTILGGNFFCSRQFDKTRLSKYIIRTIVYHLALKCKPFSDALPSRGLDSIINQNHKTQLDSLLFGPWQKSKATREQDKSLPLCYLFVIDALDEIDGTSGSDFLHALVTTINEIDKKSLSGLKFFVTSRSDPGLVKYVESLKQKQLYHLQDVQQAEAYADVTIYLQTSLPHFVNHPQMDQLVDQAAGLFIYASTVVKYMEAYDPAEHIEHLQTLFVHDSTNSQSSEDILLDTLYYQILLEASSHSKSWYYLDVLHAILCSAEPTSSIVIAQLLSLAAPTIVDKILKSLHALLYTEKDNILSYHKSFSDFIFDQARSKGFFCNKALYHQKLSTSCFKIMKDLHFNMANIPSSYIFDCENDTLVDEVKQNICSGLSYACHNWDHHLSATKPTSDNTLLGTLSDFLELDALFWIESMNLLGQCDRCYPMFQTAHDWVLKSEGKSPLPEHLAEAGFFAQYFSTGSACKSTPHLYISTLATWPRKSDPIQSWKSHFPGIPKFTNASIGGTLLMSFNVDSVVRSVAFSSNGHYIVSGSNDHLVRVWNALTGQENCVLNGHTDAVSSVAFSSNGRHIVSGSHDTSVRVWDALTGQEIHVLNGHTDVYCVAFSNDGCHIVSGLEDNSIQVWNTLTGQKMYTLTGHTAAVQSVAFSSDGSYIVSGSTDTSARVWSTAIGIESYTLNGHTETIWSVAFSPDSSYIVSSSDDKTVRVWNALTHQVMHVLSGHMGPVYSIAFSSDARHIVSGSLDNSIRMWDALTGQQKHILHGHINSVTSVAFSSNSSCIVSGSFDNSIRVSSILTDQEEHTLNSHMARAPVAVFSTDGTQIVSCSDDQTVRVWDAMKGLPKLVLKHPDKVYSVAFSSDARNIVSGSADKSVRVWSATTGKECYVLTGHTLEVLSVAISSDGTQIVSCSFDKTIRVWDATKRLERLVLNGHTDAVYSVAFSTDGSQIVSGSFDKLVCVWDALTGQKRHILAGHTDKVYSVAFSYNGRLIVSGSDDRSVRVWDALTGQANLVLEGHTDMVLCCAFSSNGSHIISSSLDKSIRIWDALTGQEIHILHGHIGGVRSVAFSMDNSQIVSSSGHGDTTLWVWVNPAHYLPSYTQEKIVTSAGHLQPSGWLLSPQKKEYLMFVPPSAALPDDAHILAIPFFHASYVNLIGSKLGLEWKECYSV